MAFNLGDALKNVPNSGTTGRQSITYLPLDSLDSDPGNFYELRDIDKLADNISVAGLQQPILVRAGKDLGRYTIVSGHRRTAALRILAGEDPDRWEEVPCIIETDAVSPYLQQLRLIYANANTRYKTAAEISEEAVQVEELLYRLKEEGYEFPGRMRDHVAEAVGASKSKLARLKVIRENLIPEFKDLFSSDKLAENTAYTLAGADSGRQRIFFDALSKRYGGETIILTQGEAANVLREMEKASAVCKGLNCPYVKGGCDHAEVRFRKASKLGPYGSLSCSGCCRDCGQLPYCGESCEYASDVKQIHLEKLKKQNAERAAAKKAEKDAQKSKDQQEKDLIALCYRRVADLRKTRNISAREFVKTSTGYDFSVDADHLPVLESGKVKLTDRMPGGIWANEAQHLIAVADLLGCSIDYLLGRDAPEPQQKAVSCWNTGDPEDCGEYIVVYGFCGEKKDLVETAYWNGTRWIMYDDELPEELTISAWTPVPREDLGDG